VASSRSLEHLHVATVQQVPTRTPSNSLHVFHVLQAVMRRLKHPLHVWNVNLERLTLRRGNLVALLVRKVITVTYLGSQVVLLVQQVVTPSVKAA
jgi:hypothetical protein